MQANIPCKGRWAYLDPGAGVSEYGFSIFAYRKSRLKRDFGLVDGQI